jgi:hypothetical protein
METIVGTSDPALIEPWPASSHHWGFNCLLYEQFLRL